MTKEEKDVLKKLKETMEKEEPVVILTGKENKNNRTMEEKR